MKSIYRSLLLVAGMFISFAAWSQFQGLPPSGDNQRSEVTQNMGLVKVTIVYNSPDVNGREIWGKLVPYGLNNLGVGKSSDQNPSPWRAGANENTVITFSHDVEVEGKPLAAGSYGLHMIPGQDEWVIIFSKNTSSWGSFFYTPSEDALRVNVKPTAVEHTEWLTYDFTDRFQNNCTARLKWEKVAVPFKLKVPNGDELYVKKFRDEFTSQRGFQWQNSIAPANFCANKKINLDEALGWVDQFINRPLKYYALYNTKANVLTAMGKAAEAQAVMMEAINLPDASAPAIVNFGRSLITASKPKEAMTVFETAYKRYPTVSATLVGMARGYNANGDNKKALKFAQDALKLETNPAAKTQIEGLVAKLTKGESIN